MKNMIRLKSTLVVETILLLAMIVALARPVATTALNRQDSSPMETSTILIANSTANDVSEVDREGQIVWQLIGLDSPIDAERLPSGNTLIAEAGANRVIEVTRSGEIVWSFSIESPARAHRLANGNILMASSAVFVKIVNNQEVRFSKILEVSRDGTEVWSTDFTGHCRRAGDPPQTFCQGVPTDAIRLANGNTLISVSDAGSGVFEVNPAGNIVLQKQVVNTDDGRGLPIFSVQELPDSHWLVTGGGVTRAQVVEMTPTGDEVWFYGQTGFCDGCLYLPRDSVRTTRGTTLIADSGKDRIIEVNTEGQIVWSYVREGSGPMSIREVPNGLVY